MADDQAAALARIEAKLDALIAALADEDEDEPAATLDGDFYGGAREEGTPL